MPEITPICGSAQRIALLCARCQNLRAGLEGSGDLTFGFGWPEYLARGIALLPHLGEKVVVPVTVEDQFRGVARAVRLNPTGEANSRRALAADQPNYTLS